MVPLAARVTNELESSPEAPLYVMATMFSLLEAAMFSSVSTRAPRTAPLLTVMEAVILPPERTSVPPATSTAPPTMLPETLSVPPVMRSVPPVRARLITTLAGMLAEEPSEMDEIAESQVMLTVPLSLSAASSASISSSASATETSVEDVPANPSEKTNSAAKSAVIPRTNILFQCSLIF